MNVKYWVVLVAFVAVVIIVLLDRGVDVVEVEQELVEPERVFTSEDYLAIGEGDTLVVGAEFTAIGDGAFSGCVDLAQITISNRVTSIGRSAFFDCAALRTVTLPSSVTRISDYTFAACVGLESVELPQGLTTIGVGAFRDCMRMRSITLPSTVTEVGALAFEQCDALNSIYISSSSPLEKELRSEYGDIVKISK